MRNINNETTSSNVNYTTLNSKWCSESKKQLKITAKIRIISRYKKIQSIICQNRRLNNFNINELEINRMIIDINNEIQSWNGVNNQLCKPRKTTYKQYKSNARSWYNKNKGKIFGNHVFYPIIFKYLLNHCIQLKNMSNDMKMSLFIEIFINIF
eukprot:530887_1